MGPGLSILLPGLSVATTRPTPVPAPAGQSLCPVCWGRGPGMRLSLTESPSGCWRVGLQGGLGRTGYSWGVAKPQVPGAAPRPQQTPLQGSTPLSMAPAPRLSFPPPPSRRPPVLGLRAIWPVWEAEGCSRQGPTSSICMVRLGPELRPLPASGSLAHQSQAGSVPSPPSVKAAHRYYLLYYYYIL